MKRIIQLFFSAGIVYMFLGVLLGGLISSGPLATYAETEAGHWIEAEHAFINFIGFFSFLLMGIVYHVLPSLSGKSPSKLLAIISFVILNAGLLLMILFTAVKSLNHLPVSFAIMTGGLLLTLGYFIFGWNVLKNL